MPASSSQKNTKAPVICVFCGASAGSNPAYLKAARDLAQHFHENGIRLVYGGGTSGLMGQLARELVSLSGPQSVHGIIPKALLRIEKGYQGDDNDVSSSLHDEAGKVERVISSEGPSVSLEYGSVTVVPDMHTRKRLMAEEVRNGGPGSGFVGLPGGFGTIEEIMEMTTWNQLGIQRTGVVLLNINGYWDGLLIWVQAAVTEGFLSREDAKILVQIQQPNQVYAALSQYRLSEDRLHLAWGDE
ncbi:unnamed protein product [Clonostachys rosea f. rosea IK726]|uniref:Cytokinin riboside 5'-monophosphate phosphoribohydrolase n=2 Tax=Bionectria ochroleuca TaxID=29856 RepID=A0A0B7KGT0_BIOOC|nr:unnamed protein product [Clonostachys rosea f. rosea IK726]